MKLCLFGGAEAPRKLKLAPQRVGGWFWEVGQFGLPTERALPDRVVRPRLVGGAR